MAVLKGNNIKDQLIIQIAQDLELSEEVVETVITHQFKHANQAMSINKQVEISGFGKFIQSQKKIKDSIRRHEQIRDAIQAKQLVKPLSGLNQKKLTQIQSELKYYNERLK